MGAGIGTAMNVGAREAGEALVVLPFRKAMSGPYMIRARCASSGVTGQFLMRLRRRMDWNSASLGRPSFRYKARALSASLISRCVNIRLFSATVESIV